MYDGQRSGGLWLLPEEPRGRHRIVLLVVGGYSGHHSYITAWLGVVACHSAVQGGAREGARSRAAQFEGGRKLKGTAPLLFAAAAVAMERSAAVVHVKSRGPLRCVLVQIDVLVVVTSYAGRVAPVLPCCPAHILSLEPQGLWLGVMVVLAGVKETSSDRKHGRAVHALYGSCARMHTIAGCGVGGRRLQVGWSCGSGPNACSA